MSIELAFDIHRYAKQWVRHKASRHGFPATITERIFRLWCIPQPEHQYRAPRRDFRPELLVHLEIHFPEYGALINPADRAWPTHFWVEAK